MSASWVIGFIVGLLVVAVVCMAAGKIIRKRGGNPGEYDERQQAVRGKAFTIAYAVLIIYLAIWMLLNSLGVSFFQNGNSVLLGIIVSITVFVAYSIFNDAYFRTSERPAVWLAIIGVVGLINIIIGVGRLTLQAAIEERLFENPNLMVGAMLAVVVVCLLLKRAMDRRTEGD